MAEIPDDLAGVLHGIFLSHISTNGERLPDLFRKNPQLRRIYDMLKTSVNEGNSAARVVIDGLEKRLNITESPGSDHLPKLGVDPIRAMRKATSVKAPGPILKSIETRLAGKAHTHTSAPTNPNPKYHPGKFTPGNKGKSQANRPQGIIDPKRRLERAKLRRAGVKSDSISRALSSSLFFIKENLNRTGGTLQRSVSNFPYPNELYQIIDHMIATNSSGWTHQGDIFVNEDGHKASMRNWVLMADGRIRPIDNKYHKYNLEWLLEVRNRLNGQEKAGRRN